VSLVAWAVVGLLAGLAANRISLAGRRGLMGDAIVGVSGAFVGGSMFHLVERLGIELHAASVIVAAMSASVVLFTYHLASGSQPRPRS
jgi:uncharacterized membrane protein YeaQ/YmgE (transglycosylase-associated protein family)